MTERSAKTIVGASRAATADLAGTLQWLLLGELIAPSGRLRLAAPLIQDSPVLDNRSGLLDAIDPDWGRRVIGLREVLARLATQGERLHLVSQMDKSDTTFMAELQAELGDLSLMSECTVETVDWIDRPGLLTGRCSIDGRLAFRREGIEILEESLTIDTRPEVVSAAWQAVLMLSRPGVL